MVRQQMDLSGQAFSFAANGSPRTAWQDSAAEAWGQTAFSGERMLQPGATEADDAVEPKRRTDDRILDLVETLPRPAKAVIPLLGAFVAVLLLVRSSGVTPDLQGLTQLAMTAALGMLVGHVLQCCSVGAMLLATRVLAAGPVILKALLIIGSVAGLAQLLSGTSL